MLPTDLRQALWVCAYRAAQDHHGSPGDIHRWLIDYINAKWPADGYTHLSVEEIVATAYQAWLQADRGIYQQARLL